MKTDAIFAVSKDKNEKQQNNNNKKIHTKMKTIRFYMVALMSLIAVTTCFADDKMILPEQLPAAAKEFLQTHFPDNGILFAQKDNDGLKKKFEVRLKDGTEVDFDKKGEWEKVDCKMKAVPAVLVPEAIATYVNANFPGEMIVKIDKERYGYDIELSNDLDLKFNKQGMLIGMDD